MDHKNEIVDHIDTQAEYARKMAEAPDSIMRRVIRQRLNLDGVDSGGEG